jgi:hypothetical protein
MATFSANYEASTGVAFDPSKAGSTITDSGVLTAVNAAWH